MSYKPMTADEAAKLSLRPEGNYAFDVLDAKDARSKEKGNLMIALTLGFYDDNGDRFTVKDWLVHSDNRWSEKKFYDFANTTGLTAKYSAGTLCAEDCLGRSGFASVGIEPGKPKSDGSGNFADKNKVKFYVTAKPAAKASPTDAQLANQAPAKSDELDGDVPF
jgi:hypothetical protein